MSTTEAGYCHNDYDFVIRGTVDYEGADRSTGWGEQYSASVDEVWLYLPKPHSNRQPCQPRYMTEAYELSSVSYIDPENESRVCLADLDEDELEEALCEAARDDYAERRADSRLDAWY